MDIKKRLLEMYDAGEVSKEYLLWLARPEEDDEEPPPFTP